MRETKKRTNWLTPRWTAEINCHKIVLMTRPALSPSEEKNKPILIVDKIGVLGRLIASELSKDLLVLLVSGGRKFDEDSRNIIHIPYLKKFAAIPDNTYSYIVIFDENDSGVEESFPAFIKNWRGFKTLHFSAPVVKTKTLLTKMRVRKTCEQVHKPYNP